MSGEDSELRARRERVAAKARAAIAYLSAVDLAAAASVLRVGRIEVTEDPAVPTAALVRDNGFSGYRFRIVLNSEFCDRSERDVTAILLHELLHHVMRHIDPDGQRVGGGESPQLSNVVEDAYINRCIELMNPTLAGFMRDFYDPAENPVCFLRARSSPADEDDQQMYRHLYAGDIAESELYDYLKQRLKDDGKLSEVVVIGSHGDQPGDRESILDVDKVQEIAEEIGEQMRAHGKDGRKEAGKFDRMVDDWVRVHRAERDSTVQAAFRRALIDKVRAQVVRAVIGDADNINRRSPLMPERVARPDIYWLLAGMTPLLWRSPDEGRPSGAVSVYIDVSGSMGKDVEFIYSCCLAFSEYLDTGIHLFSNRIDTISLAELRSGKLTTTYGTDFDCVVEHFLDQENISRAVLFTDGRASLNAHLEQQLHASSREVIAVLTASGSDQAVSEFCTEVFRMPAHDNRNQPRRW